MVAGLQHTAAVRYIVGGSCSVGRAGSASQLGVVQTAGPSLLRLTTPSTIASSYSATPLRP